MADLMADLSARIRKLEDLMRVQLSRVGGAVSSVFGRAGAVVAATNDYTWAQIDKTTSSLADITTKSHTALSDIGTNTHAQIDTHLAATTAHGSSGAVVGATTLAADIATHAALTATHGATGAVVGTTNTQTLTNKTLTTPIISSISNTGTLTLPTATDTLVGRATTDTLTNKSIAETQLTLTDITTNNATTTAHGLMPKGTGSTTTFYRSDMTQATPAGGSGAWSELQTVVVGPGAGSASVRLTVPAGYRSLWIMAQFTASGANEVQFNFNNDRAANKYKWQNVGAESTVTFGAATSTTYGQAVKNADTDENALDMIVNNNATGKRKTFVSRGGNIDKLSYTNGYWTDITQEIAIIDFTATTFSASSRFILLGLV